MSNPSAVEELFSSVFEEAQQLNKVAQINQVDVILEKYDAVMNEYWAIVKNNGMHPQLLEIVDKILNMLCKSYPKYLTRRNLTVLNTGYIPVWGPKIWDFIHKTSLLLIDLKEKGKITNFMNFASVVYNLDSGLPCTGCASNFSEAKPQFTSSLEVACAGNIVEFAQGVHRVVSLKVANQRGYTPPKTFTAEDFMLHYGCYPNYIRQSTTEGYLQKRLIFSHPKFVVFARILRHQKGLLATIDECCEALTRVNIEMMASLFLLNPPKANPMYSREELDEYAAETFVQFLSLMPDQTSKCLAKFDLATMNQSMDPDNVHVWNLNKKKLKDLYDKTPFVCPI